MANGTVRVIDKEEIESVQDADYFIVIKDGKVMLAKPGNIGSVSVIDEDEDDTEYACSFRIRNGHLVISATKFS